MDSAKNYFVLFMDTLGVHEKLSDEQLGKLFRAMILWHKGEPVELDFALDLLFSSFVCQFERDRQKNNNFTRKQVENGQKGGRPPQKEQKKIITETPKINEKTENIKENPEIDGKEKYGEFVRLSWLESQKLMTECEHSEELFEKIIGDLNLAIGRADTATVRAKYSSHYHAFLSFLRFSKERARSPADIPLDFI